jgi:predicted transcriptional regulator of viral defense system
MVQRNRRIKSASEIGAKIIRQAKSAAQIGAAKVRKAKSASQIAVEKFRRRHGVLRTVEALREGIHPRTLYELRDQGTLEQLSRGVFRLADSAPLSNPDLVTVAIRIPAGVICLLSALAFHELTTHIPHEVSVAIRRGKEPPRLEYPPVHVYWFSGRGFTEGIETHVVDKRSVHVYSREKTIADCFLYQQKIGLDICLEALRAYCRQPGRKFDELLRVAAVRRVTKTLRPYLEAIA